MQCLACSHLRLAMVCRKRTERDIVGALLRHHSVWTTPQQLPFKVHHFAPPPGGGRGLRIWDLGVVKLHNTETMEVGPRRDKIHRW